MNRSLILFAALLLTCNLLKAQTSAGTQNLGLDLGFSTANTNYPANGTTQLADREKSTAFNIGPTYNYFIADKMDIGAIFSYSTSDQSNTTFASLPNTDYKTIYGEIFARKYFMVNDKFGFRAGPYLGFSRNLIKYSYENEVENTTQNETDAGVRLDLAFYPMKHFGFSITLADLNYDHETSNSANGNFTTNGFSFSSINSGLSASIFYIF